MSDTSDDPRETIRPSGLVSDYDLERGNGAILPSILWMAFKHFL